MPLGVVPYDPVWPRVFEVIRAGIDAALADVPHSTEHVGSTAVPGLVAKPIIDVCVVVPSATAVAGAAAGLARLGYAHEGDLGITGREAFRAPPGTPAQHLYVVVAESRPHLDQVRFRDFLRAPPGARPDLRRPQAGARAAVGHGPPGLRRRQGRPGHRAPGPGSGQRSTVSYRGTGPRWLLISSIEDTGQPGPAYSRRAAATARATSGWLRQRARVTCQSSAQELIPAGRLTDEAVRVRERPSGGSRPRQPCARP